MKDDIPTQGRISTGVRGIKLRDGDEVVLMTQITNDEGEILIVTTEGKFKKVVVPQIEKSKRYLKGTIIVGLTSGTSVLTACYVTVPYKLAVVSKTHEVSEISSEDVFIATQSAKAMKLSGYLINSIEQVLPMPYKKDE